MSDNVDAVKRSSFESLENWLASCTRGKKVSRNTIAVGIVVLDHLRKGCPASKSNVLSKGGEIKGARSGLGKILETYGIQKSYLKEVTTRQAHQDGQRLLQSFEWGKKLASLSIKERDKLLRELIGSLCKQAQEWLKRQNLKLEIDRSHAPMSWVHVIVQNARERSAGIVEQHLVGAKLERRFRNMTVPNHPAHAGDKQTGREGDFAVSKLVYHVTANPTQDVLRKCAANIKAGKHPMLLVPSDLENKARLRAEDAGIDNHLAIVSLEGFLGLNIIELAAEENRDCFGVLQEIVQIYNRRLEEVETDLSLQIEVC